MSKVFLAGFKAGKHRYEQVVDVETEETSLSIVDSSEVIYRVNAGGWVYNKHNALAGRFGLMENKCWYYETMDKSMRLNTKYKELLEAERDVFSLILSLGYNE